MQIPVSKYHGCGNDFIMAREEAAEGLDRTALVRAACDRHTGIGADGMIFVKQHPLEMIYFNQDGSRAPMCGNGIRCFAAFCYDEGICTDALFPVQTLAGEKTVKRLGTDPFFVQIGMGKPDYRPEKLDLDTEELQKLEQANAENPFPQEEKTKLVQPDAAAKTKAVIWGLPAALSACGGKTVRLYSFFMSTVHTVVFVEDAFSPENEAIGREICHLPLFSKQTNVNFVQVIDKTHLRMQTYERGCGITLACGTGACASVVCAHRLGLCSAEASVELRRGTLQIALDKEEAVQMTGPAARIMKGTFFF